MLVYGEIKHDKMIFASDGSLMIRVMLAIQVIELTIETNFSLGFQDGNVIAMIGWFVSVMNYDVRYNYVLRG